MLKTLATDFIGLFYPDNCCGCGTALQKGETHLCLYCLYRLPFTEFEKDADNPVSKILHGRFPFQFATSLFYFAKDSAVQNMIHHLKYNEGKELGVYLGKLMGEKLKESPVFNMPDVILPIPLHSKKQKIRGYNQSVLLSQGVSEAVNIPYADNILIRRSNTATQTHKSRIERWENVENEFQVVSEGNLSGKHVLLMDDVITTGATIDACAQSLLRVPGIQISVATLAIASF